MASMAVGQVEESLMVAHVEGESEMCLISLRLVSD